MLKKHAKIDIYNEREEVGKINTLTSVYFLINSKLRPPDLRSLLDGRSE
jgi:hypothetical protein